MLKAINDALTGRSICVDRRPKLNVVANWATVEGLGLGRTCQCWLQVAGLWEPHHPGKCPDISITYEMQSVEYFGILTSVSTLVCCQHNREGKKSGEKYSGCYHG